MSGLHAQAPASGQTPAAGGSQDPADPIRGFTARRFEDPAGSLPYRLRVPAEIEEGERLPLVVSLHAEPERGEDNVAQLRNLPRRITRSRELRSFVAAPQLPRGTTWAAPGRVEQIEALTAGLLKEFPQIDPDRIYAVGQGIGAVGIAEWSRKHPERLAAVLLADGPYTEDPRPLKAPSAWIWHGALDSIADPQTALRLARRSVRAGVALRQTLLDREGHASWNEAFDPREGLAWLFARARNRVDPGPFLLWDGRGIGVVDPLRPEVEVDRFEPAQAGDLIDRVAEGFEELATVRSDRLGRRLLVLGRGKDGSCSLIASRWPEARDRSFDTIDLSLSLEEPAIDAVLTRSGTAVVLFESGKLALYRGGRSNYRPPLATREFSGASVLAVSPDGVLLGSPGKVDLLDARGGELTSRKSLVLRDEGGVPIDGGVLALCALGSGVAVATETGLLFYADWSVERGVRWNDHGLERIDGLSVLPGGRLAVHGPGRTAVLESGRFVVGYDFPAEARLRAFR